MFSKSKKSSPIKKVGDVFALNPDLPLNKFAFIGISTRGRAHIILLSEPTTNYRSLSLLVDPIEHSVECVQYLITGAEEKVIGSLFDVNKKLLNFNGDRILIHDSDDVTTFTCGAETGPGGTLVYNDEEGSTVIVPLNPQGDLLRNGQ